MKTYGLWLACSVLALSSATGATEPAKAPSAPAPAGPRAVASPADRRVFFGELHLHTTMSFDAWTFGTKVTPDQAYKFASGQTVMVPAAQVASQEGIQGDQPVAARRAWPLDFAAVTDHSEFVGALSQLDKPDSDFTRSDYGQKVKAMGARAFFLLNKAMDNGSPEFAAASKASDAWNVEMRAANGNYRPGKFTTFIAYEWTSTPDGRHMHRNVIFNADHAPPPFTAAQSKKPEDLWAYLEAVRKQGIEVLAIPHNGNLSGGMTFDWNRSDGQPIDEAYAQERALNEPLTEIVQNKGQSDTMPELSPNDEFANFEVFDRLYPGETKPTLHHGSYVREAYGRGLVIQSKVGVNPFKMGIVGASDIHNGLSASDENAMTGGATGVDPATMMPTGAAALKDLGEAPDSPHGNGKIGENDPLVASSAGITGVWAEANNRASIFAALKRKETFATSGPRIRVRMFAGWGFQPAMLKTADWVAKAYAEGTPMGGDLPLAGAKAKAPTFILQAMKDPTGANLDRIQVIKVWLEGGGYKEKVFDVALSGGRRDDPATGKAPAVGNTVDLKTGAYKNTIGAASFTTTWRDPEFNPKVPAVYYARVLEIPTPRWSTLLAIKNKLPIPTSVAQTIQERAWSSPIWFNPRKG